MKLKVPKQLFILLVVLFIAAIFLVFTGTDPSENESGNVADRNVFIKVKGGYFPDDITVSANELTKITFVTEDTYDCSAGITVPDLGIETVLPSTGRTEVLLPQRKAGTIAYGGCSSAQHDLIIRYE